MAPGCSEFLAGDHGGELWLQKLHASADNVGTRLHVGVIHSCASAIFDDIDEI